MALFPCNIGSSGGTMSETVLWTNPNSTSDFTTQTVTLNESVANFKYLKATYKITKSDSDIAGCAIKPVSEFYNCTSINTTGDKFAMIAGYTGAGSGARMIVYVSNTSIQITGRYALGGTQTHNDYVTPVQIIGLK